MLLLLVFGMTFLGVSAMNSLSDAVRAELVTLRERNVLAQTITHDVVTAVRTGDDARPAPGFGAAGAARLDHSPRWARPIDPISNSISRRPNDGSSIG